MKRKTLAWFVLAVCLPGLFGCQAWQTPAMYSREIESTLKQVGTSLAAQTIWDHADARLHAQVNEPSIETRYTQTHSVGVFLGNTAGTFTFGGTGHGIGDLPPELQAELIRLGMADENMREKMAEVFAQLLLGKQESEPETPDPNIDGEVE